jgi:menaquinone-9 beta-reductase
MRTDVCVAGGGPAGLAAAIALRREGFGVAIVDCAVPPIDKACGEGLMPAGIPALRDLGVTIPPDLGRPLEGHSILGWIFHNGGEVLAWTRTRNSPY